VENKKINQSGVEAKNIYKRGITESGGKGYPPH